MKKMFMTLGAVGILSLVSLGAGGKPVHAYPIPPFTAYTCTYTSGDLSWTVTVYRDTQEDYLESLGFSCTGD